MKKLIENYLSNLFKSIGFSNHLAIENIVVDNQTLTRDFRQKNFPLIFEEIKEYILTNCEESDRKTIYPFGEDSDEIYGERYSFSDLNYDIDYMFDIENGRDENKFSIREKIYIGIESLEEAKDIKCWPLVLNLFGYGEKVANDHEIESKLKKGNVEYYDQLMLIKYSVSEKLKEEDKNHFFELCSRRFGVAHEDETFYSVHLGETSEEVHEWCPVNHKWVKMNFDRGRTPYLMGEFSCEYGYVSTFHQLISGEQTIEDRGRYSFIFERVPLEPKKKLQLDTDSDFARLDLHRLREEKTAFVIAELFEENEFDTELVSLTKKHLNIHLFFFYRGIKECVDVVRSNNYQGTVFERLEKEGFEKVVIVPSGLMIQNEKYVNMLLTYATKLPRMLFVFYPWHFKGLLGFCVCNIGAGRGRAIDNMFKERGILKSYSWAPHFYIENVSPPFGVDNLFTLTNFSPSQKSLEESSRKLDFHLKSGFERVFLFNTEFYNEIDTTDFKKAYSLVGLSSGFKLTYMACKAKESVRTIVYYDINKQSLLLKKKMVEEWDGENFPQWLKDNIAKDEMTFVENDESYLVESWERELVKWGGASCFKKSWLWYKTLEFEYHEIDCLAQTERFVSLLPEKGGALWISNIWNNEYVYSLFGNDLKSNYIRWLEKIREHNSSIILFQSGIYIDNKFTRKTGCMLEEAYRELC